MQNGIHRDKHHVVNGDDGKRRKAQCQYLFCRRQADASARQANRRPLSMQEDQRTRCARHLRKHRRDRRAAHAHIQRKDEQRVKRYVHRRAQYDQFHRLRRKALRNDQLVQSRRQQRKHRSGEICREISIRIGVDGLACSEKAEHRRTKRDDQRHHRQRKDEQHRKARPQNALRFLIPSLAHSDAHQRRTAPRNPDRRRPDHRHHRTADTDACQSDFAHVRDMPDVHSVHDAVQHADELRQHARQRYFQHQRTDFIPSEVVFLLHGTSLTL